MVDQGVGGAGQEADRSSRKALPGRRPLVPSMPQVGKER
jgi:hypothetical protein